jgi:hypothetical protein
MHGGMDLFRHRESVKTVDDWKRTVQLAEMGRIDSDIQVEPDSNIGRR